MTETKDGVDRAADALIAMLGRDGYVLVTQFLKCDAAGRAELVDRAIALANQNPIKNALKAL